MPTQPWKRVQVQQRASLQALVPAWLLELVLLLASRPVSPLVQALQRELALPLAWPPGLVLLLALQPGPLRALPQALVLLLASPLVLPLMQALQQELALLQA